MAFSIAAIPAKDGTGATIVGGVDFIDTSGAGTGPYIIGKTLIDPAGVNTQAINSSSEALVHATQSGDWEIAIDEALPAGTNVIGHVIVDSVASSSTGGYSFLNITTDATTTVKSGAGTLHTITVNTLAATSTIKIYDNTAASGTVIATIGGGVQTTYVFDLAFSTGLTIVTAIAAPDITVTYK